MNIIIMNQKIRILQLKVKIQMTVVTVLKKEYNK